MDQDVDKDEDDQNQLENDAKQRKKFLTYAMHQVDTDYDLRHEKLSTALNLFGAMDVLAKYACLDKLSLLNPSPYTKEAEVKETQETRNSQISIAADKKRDEVRRESMVELPTNDEHDVNS